MKRLRVWAVGLVFTAALLGCSTATEHRQAVRADEAGRRSAGKIQREIGLGMTSSAVAEALGAPNVKPGCSP